jgi:hypothetical protein
MSCGAISFAILLLSTTPSSRRPSEIEILVMREGVLYQEQFDLTNAAEELSAQNLFRGDIDARLRQINEEVAAIGELLTHRTPETVREIGIMLRCSRNRPGKWRARRTNRREKPGSRRWSGSQTQSGALAKT